MWRILPDGGQTIAVPGPQGYLKELRSLVGSRCLIVPGIRAVICDSEGRILLQERSDLRAWGLPAGSVDLGESAHDALVREVKEETGLDVLSARPLALYTDPRYVFTYPNGDKIQLFELAFIVDRWRGDLYADGRETLALRFFPPAHLPSQMCPFHKESIEDYLQFGGQFLVK